MVSFRKFVVFSFYQPIKHSVMHLIFSLKYELFDVIWGIVFDIPPNDDISSVLECNEQLFENCGVAWYCLGFVVIVDCMDIDVAPLSDFRVIYAFHIWLAVCDRVETAAERL